MAQRTRLLAALLSATTCAGAYLAPPALAAPDAGPPAEQTWAVVGDLPYGPAQVEAFPGWVDDINAAAPDAVFHLGDIKSGSTRCDDQYYRDVKTQFDRVAAPLLYTPGDNEWTDCHRPNNGSYDPLERLEVLRSVFYTADQHRGDRRNVRTEAAAGFPENVSFRREGIDVALVHVVGSNNGTLPWAGLGRSEPTAAQLAEEQARTDNALDLVRRTFATARQKNDRAVVLMMQADMFDPTWPVTYEAVSAFEPLVRLIAAESAGFDGEVYLFDGDSHVFHVDRPLAAGSSWLQLYGVSTPADNLTRVTVDGSSNNWNWLEVTVAPRGDHPVLSWQRVPYSG